MNLKVVGHYSHLILVFMALLMIVPIGMAVAEDDLVNQVAFGVTFLVTILFSILLRQLGDSKATVNRYDAFAIVGFTWIAVSLIGGLPFLLSGTIGSVPGAIFESVSGFTTTGASVISDIDNLPKAINLWRHLSHWIGGMGIVVLFVAIFPHLGMGAKHLFRSEAAGPINEALKPRIRHTALRLWWIYAGLTLVCLSLYKLAGMEWFDAVCHAFSTLATGGFSTKTNSIAAFDSSLVEWIAVVFMFLGGLNFGLFYASLNGNFKALVKDYEVRFFSLIIGLTAGTIVFYLVYSGTSIEDSVRTGLFQTLAVVTTTGFAVEDWNLYPDLIRVLIFFLMFLGGCAGSTAGGMKVSRVYIVLQEILNEIRSVLRPQVVQSTRIGGKTVSRDIVQNIFSFMAVYILIFVVASVLLAALGLDYTTATSSAAATLSSLGPALGEVGPASNYAMVPDLGKLVLAFCMIAGRLEIFVILAIFSPLMWQR